VDPAELDKQIVDEPCHILLISVYAGDQLRNNLKPDLSRRVPDALVEHVVDLGVVAVVEPDGEHSGSWRRLSSV